MSPDEFATAFVPLPLAWRYVVTGDVIAGKGGAPWLALPLHAGTTISVRLLAGLREWSGPVDPDEQVQVLTPVPMAQAIALTKAELGARLIAARTDAGGVAA